MAIGIFLGFVLFVLCLSFYLGRKAKSASGYFAAGGQIHWGVNGIAFAGDYLSAASFLGICGMIATSGYDGYLYSIGYLAGWIVALFVVAEPMKRLGRYTFTDALDSTFNNPGIQLAAGISTLVVSLCYLIPQMVGAGTLVEPLLGIEHHWGVIMVGAIVIFIVATAGMASTTYVQFLKGLLLIVFSTVLVYAMCSRGLTTEPEGQDKHGKTLAFHQYEDIQAPNMAALEKTLDQKGYRIVGQNTIKDNKTGETLMSFVKLAALRPLTHRDGAYYLNVKDRGVCLVKDSKGLLDKLLKQAAAEKQVINGITYIHEERDGVKFLVLYEGKSTVIDGLKVVEAEDGKLYADVHEWWMMNGKDGMVSLRECQSVVTRPSGGKMVNGAPLYDDNELRGVGTLTKIKGKSGKEAATGGLGPIGFLSELTADGTEFLRWKYQKFDDAESKVTLYYAVPTPGKVMMRPGLYFKTGSTSEKLNFISLMLALFCGTAALPHILIRYYTVPSPAAARKSTIVAIAAIGFFYILTMYLGLGAAVNSSINPADGNMSAPLLARAFNEVLFAIISAIAFATVLGTVSGLIVAASGAVAHDLLDRFCNLNMTDKQKVGVGKLAAFAVGLVAIILGIVFKGMNVSFLVGWAFAVAASANLPAIIMLLFWKKTTAKGIVASIVVGMVSALGIILVSPEMYERYGLKASDALISFGQPGIISIPLSFLTLIVVSLLTQGSSDDKEDPITL